MARARSSVSPASGAVFAHWRRITSAPTWITTCQGFFSGCHSTVAVLFCVIVLLQPQITVEIREREGSGVGQALPPANPSFLRQPGAPQQRIGVWVAAHEAAIEFGGVFAVALRQNLAAEGGADLAAEDAAIAEAGEGVGLQHLGPLIGVIARAVTHRRGEQVRE